MGLKGAIVGALVGTVFGSLGSLLGSIIGSGLEEKMRHSPRRGPTAGLNNPSAIFCASAAAMLAKMAKVDGRITKDEIAVVEQAFSRLGFSADMRAYAVRVFRKAKDDTHAIYEYAHDFASAVTSTEIRVLFYELLWDLACADGVVTGDELTVLQRITSALRIPNHWYFVFAGERLRGGRGSGFGGSSAGAAPASGERLADAYRQLGVPASASDADVRKAYHRMAKKYHPDTLRAQGLPEEMVGKATERMSKINAAWAAIREERKL